LTCTSYEHHDHDASRHLLKSPAGSTRWCWGTEILGQVKDAYHAANKRVPLIVLNRLSKKLSLPQNTSVPAPPSHAGSTSVGTVAVDLAEKIFGKLGKCTVMVIGTGEMSGRPRAH